MSFEITAVMPKYVIILNGKGGVGKDTLVNFLAKKYNVIHESSVTPIKECAKVVGWTGGKTLEDRKFLHDLKMLVTNYNDYVTTYLKRVVDEFLHETKNTFLFIDIREASEITNFLQNVYGDAYTLLITRQDVDKIDFGNSADDDVTSYKYDRYYDNDLSYEEAEDDFISFIEYWFELKDKFRIEDNGKMTPILPYMD